jgi:tetratricopeptide (TPR) repeat protein
MWMAALAAAVFAVFVQVLRFPFTTWDDPMMVTQNPWLHPVRPESFTHFWRYPYYDFFTPLLYHVYALLALISHALHPGQGNALSPSVFHAANLALHLANVLIMFHLLIRLGSPKYGAFLGALLLAIHPLVAEPVAWISSVDTLLVTFLCLLAVWQYLLYAGIGGQAKRRWLHFALASVFFFLAVIAKPTALCLPVMVLVLEALLFRRSLRAFGLPLLGWFTFAFLWSFLVRHVQYVPPDVPIPLWQRPFVAGDALFFYLTKLFWPYPQALVYGRTPPYVLGHAWGYVTWLLPAAVAFVAWRIYRAFPALAVGFGLMAAGALPTLGLIPFQYQAISTVGDRYMYLAMIGPSLILATLAARLRPPALYALFALLLVGGIVSFVQAGVWRSSDSLYRHSLAINPSSPDLHDKMGDLYMQWRNPVNAVEEYRTAAALAPTQGLIYYNLATASAQAGDVPGAVAAYQRAIALQPDYPRSYFGLGLVYAETGQTAQAVDEWQQGLALAPDDTDYHYNLGLALLRLGRYEESAQQFRIVLALEPGSPTAQYRLQQALQAEERSGPHP